MPRGLRIAAWSVAGLLALIVVLVGALLIVGNTDSGRELIARLTADLTKGHVRLSGIHGSFPSALDLDRLELADDAGVWLFAEHISLRWSPSALLARHVDVDSLHVARLHVERPPLPDKEKKPSSNPSIPHSDLRDVAIDTLELGKALAGEPASLVLKGRAHVRSLQEATAFVAARRSGGNGDYELQVNFDPRRMDGSLKLEEPANGPLENLLKLPGLGGLSVLAKLNGPRNAETIELKIDAGPLRGRARGAIDLVGRAADLDYSLTAPQMTPSPGLTWQSVDLQGRFHGPLTAPLADGHLLVKALQVPGGVQLAALEATLTASAGSMNAQAGIDGLMIPGPQPALLRGSRLSLDATLHLSDAKRPLDLTATHRLFALQAKAITAGEQSAQLDLRLPDVAPLFALAGQRVRGGALVKAQIARDQSKTTLSANADANLDAGAAAWAPLVRGAPTRLQLTGNLTAQQIEIERLLLSGRAVSLAASGTMARAGSRDIDTRVELGLPDLAKLAPALAGNLKLTGKIKGPSDSLSAAADMTSTLSVHGSPPGALSARVTAAGIPKAARGTVEAHGDLDGAPLRINASLEHGGGGVYHAVIQHVDWKSAHVDGDLTSGADVAQARGDVRLRMGQLSDLDRLLGSALQGSVNGTVALRPAAGGSRAQIQLEAQDVVAGGIAASGQLNASGTMDALDIQLTAQSPQVAGQPLKVTGTARLDASARELRLDTLDALYRAQSFRLLSPATLSFKDGFAMTGVKVGAQKATLEADGRISPALDMHAKLAHLGPELINAFAPHLLAAGTIDGDAQIRGSFAAPTGNVHVEALGMRAADDAALGLPATDIRATAELAGDTANVDVKLAAGNASKLALAGRTPLAASGALDLKLAGNLDMALLNPLLEAGGRHVTGSIAIDTTVTGEAADPEIGGTVRLTKGSLRDYRQGVNLSEITGLLSGSHGLLRIEKLTARAAPGDVSVEGTIGVLQPKIPVDLQLSAKNAQPIANNIITANLNADIKVTGTARENLQVAGNIHVNRADVGIPSGLPPNVAVLDVRRPGRAPPPVSSKPLVIDLNITVDAPRQILVKGRGLDAEMGGELRIRGTTASPSVGGGFELQRGFFTLASSKLTFSNGNVTFSGAGLKNKIDPTLDFMAQSQVADVTAIVRITGLADAPKIELSSTPDLPQDEILARLLFGQSAAQLSALQVVQIGAALTTLGGGGSLNPVAKIQKALGLDRLSVGSGTSTGPTGAQRDTGASIEAGRYVSSRVFVAVKESTTGASQLGVDVDLTKGLKLQAKVGNGTATAQGTTPENDPGSSVGLAYQFEY